MEAELEDEEEREEWLWEEPTLVEGLVPGADTAGLGAPSGPPLDWGLGKKLQETMSKGSSEKTERDQNIL